MAARLRGAFTDLSFTDSYLNTYIHHVMCFHHDINMNGVCNYLFLASLGNNSIITSDNIVMNVSGLKKD